MKNILFLLCIVGLVLAGETEIINVDNVYRISPDLEVTSSYTTDNNLSASSPRIIITFDLPEDLLDENNLVREATLVIQIEPSREWDGTEPIMAYCLPLTEPVSGATVWVSSHDAFEFKYPELGVYKPSRGYIFFEISPMLNAAANGEINFYGVMIIPTRDSESFNLADIASSVEFRTANVFGAIE